MGQEWFPADAKLIEKKNVSDNNWISLDLSHQIWLRWILFRCMFFVNRAIELQSVKLLECVRNDKKGVARILDSANGQFAFEVSIFEAAINHVDRTFNESFATTHLLPLLPFVSSSMGTCGGSTHKARIDAALREVSRVPKHVPIVMTCTCVMERTLFSGLFEQFHAHRNIIQLSHSTRPYPMSISDRVIVVPYYSQHQTAAACSFDGTIYWRGSPVVADGMASRVRRHIMSFRHHSSFDVSASTRGGCGIAYTCINGFGVGRDRHAKRDMRRNMTRHQFCLVPEGDSPESSRLSDAVAALCTPIVISERVPVLQSDAWTDAVLAIKPDEFLTMSANDVARRARASKITCDSRLRLRHTNTATSILHRLSYFVAQSATSHVFSVVG